MCGLLIMVWKVDSRLRRRGLPLPPGPEASWLGTVKAPQSYPWLTYAQWNAIYGKFHPLKLILAYHNHASLGDLIYLRVLGNPILVLNSATAVSDLLEKRSGNYSSRPVRTMVVELYEISC